jgi:hypothetical protein
MDFPKILYQNKNNSNLHIYKKFNGYLIVLKSFPIKFFFFYFKVNVEYFPTFI